MGLSECHKLLEASKFYQHLKAGVLSLSSETDTNPEVQLIGFKKREVYWF